MDLTVLDRILFLLFSFAAFSLFAGNIERVLSYIRLGKSEDRFYNPIQRIKNVFVIALAQTKLFKEPVSGTLHAFIFWGFVVFLFSVVEVFFQVFNPQFTYAFLGIGQAVITITSDIFVLLVLGSLITVAYRRYIMRIKRLDVDTHGKIDAGIILLLIFSVVGSMFLQSVMHSIKGLNETYDIRPVSNLVAGLFTRLSRETVSDLHHFFWWLHGVFVLAFLNYLPFSKHLHVITSVPNVYLGKIGDNKYSLKPLNLEDETIEKFGVQDIDDLKWKQLLDGFSCTECGRCTNACPANTVGKKLSPRKIITDIRDRTIEKAPLLLSGITHSDVLEKNLVGDFISSEELWACTTCMACVEECPVLIEHVDAIVDMRRHLVLDESEFPKELQTTFKNLEEKGSPWAFSPVDRDKWAEGLNIKTMAEDSNADVLFWVGCAGSFDTRYKKVSVAFSKIMQEAGVNFRILGSEEQCNGDAARRLGNEYLAQMMMQQNIETLNGYNVKNIVTACPHCFNSLKNEYPQFGGRYEVKHHTEFIEELVEQGKVTLKPGEGIEKVTYHDSCYLGRYNEVYDEPRTLIEKAMGKTTLEPERNKEKGMCCGAGGGRMFLEEDVLSRVNVERTNELIATGADTISVACPFCMTMVNDGVKTAGKENEIQIKDVAEIVFNQLQINQSTKIKE